MSGSYKDADEAALRFALNHGVARERNGITSEPLTVTRVSDKRVFIRIAKYRMDVWVERELNT